MNAEAKDKRLLMSHNPLTRLHNVRALDETGCEQAVQIAGEEPLTLYLNKREIVTLMTLGREPEKLVLGYLWNQGFVTSLDDVAVVQVDWEVNAAAVVAQVADDIEARLSHRTVTTGCGQGTVFGDLMARIGETRLPHLAVRQSTLYALLANLARRNDIYRQAGAVHGCALCRGSEVLAFVEDVGRHNAVDALAGEMLLSGMRGDDLIFYTTGRLTSEMVIKVAQMGIPVLLSRSGITAMGLELARQVGLTLIARAKGRHFLIFHDENRVMLDGPGEA